MQSQDAANPCEPSFSFIKVNNEGLHSSWDGARVGAGRKVAFTRGKQVCIPADLVIRYIKGKSTIFEHDAWELCRLSFIEWVYVVAFESVT